MTERNKWLFEMVEQENASQVRKWGVQNRTPFEWMTLLTEEVGELARAISELKFRIGTRREVVDESIQVATLALKIAEMFGERAEEDQNEDLNY